MQNKGRGKTAKVVNFVAKWLNFCLSTVVVGTSVVSVVVASVVVVSMVVALVVGVKGLP